MKKQVKKQKQALNEVKKAILAVRKAGSSKDQFKYDTMRSRDYSMILQTLKHIKPKDVLEVGCAYGTLSYLLKKSGIDVKATDIEVLHNPKFFKKHKIDYSELNVETDEIDKQDCIIFTEVMEHLSYNPLPVLKKMKRALRKRGFIILSVPAREYDFPREHIGKWLNHINWRQIPNFKKYKQTDANNHYYYLWELLDLFKEAELRPDNLLRTQAGWFIILTR